MREAAEGALALATANKRSENEIDIDGVLLLLCPDFEGTEPNLFPT